MSRLSSLAGVRALPQLVTAAGRAVHGAPLTLLALALPVLVGAWVAGAASHGPLAARLDASAAASEERWQALSDDPAAVFPSPMLLELVHGGSASEILRAATSSGIGATLLAAGIALALLHGPLQCGALAVLRSRAQGERPPPLLAAAARFAWPATALSLLAAAGYATCLAAIDRLGRLAAELSDRTGLLDSNAVRALGDTARLGLLLAGLFVVRSLLDLSRAALVERGSRSGLRPAAQALRSLPALAGSLLPLYFLYWLARLAAFALGWPIGALIGGSWAALACGFVLQQLLAGSLAGIRIVRLETVRRLLASHEERNAPAVYKLEAPAAGARG